MEWSVIESKYTSKARKLLMSHCKENGISKKERERIKLEILGILQSSGSDSIAQIKQMLQNGLWSISRYDKVQQDCLFECKCLEEPTTVAKGIFTCPQCGSKNTMSFEVQKRRADEPMTNFVTCYNPEQIPKDKVLWKKVKGNQEKYRKLGGLMGRCNHRWSCQ